MGYVIEDLRRALREKGFIRAGPYEIWVSPDGEYGVDIREDVIIAGGCEARRKFHRAAGGLALAIEWVENLN